MKSIDEMQDYADVVGGVFSDDEIEAIPFNHWKRDYEWLVMIVDTDDACAFVAIQALTPEDAARFAINKYNLQKDRYD